MAHAVKPTMARGRGVVPRCAFFGLSSFSLPRAGNGGGREEVGGSGCHALSLPVVCVCVCVWCLTPVPHVTRVHGPRRARAVEALSGVPPTHHAGILSTGVCMRDPAALLPLSLPLALLHVPGMSRFGNQPFGRTRDMWALSAVPVPAGEPLACEGDAGRRGLPQSHDMAPAEWEEAMHCKHPGLT